MQVAESAILVVLCLGVGCVGKINFQRSEIYFKHENSRMEESDSTRDKIDSLRAT